MKLEDAIAKSKYRTAVSEAVIGDADGKMIWIECVKPEGKHGHWVEHGRPGTHLLRASAGDINEIRNWRPM